LEEDDKSHEQNEIKLISKEGAEFLCSREAAMASATIAATLTGQWRETSGPIPTIRFEEISTPILAKLIEYFNWKKMYDGAKAPYPKLSILPDELVPLLLAANFLDM